MSLMVSRRLVSAIFVHPRYLSESEKADSELPSYHTHTHTHTHARVRAHTHAVSTLQFEWCFNHMLCVFSRHVL